MKMKTLTEIQAEIKHWAHHNFGNQPSWTSILGMVEEWSELTLADCDGTKSEKIDAICDLHIYLLNFCSMEDIDLEREIDACEENDVSKIGLALGKLCHHYLKDNQNIRTNEDHEAGILDAVLGIWFALRRYCIVEGIAMHEELNKTWEVVRQRDWTKNKETGV